MRIVQALQDDYLPTICGNALVVNSYVKMLKTKFPEHKVVVWENDRPEHEVVEGVSVTNILDSKEMIAHKISRMVKNENVDVLIVHSHEDRVSKHLSNISMDVTRILVQHFEDSRLLKSIDNYHGAIVFQKKQYEDYLRMGIPKEKLLLCPPSLDFEKDYVTPPPLSERTPRSIIYAGRIIEAKGCHQIIPHLEKIDATYTIIGPLSDKKYIDRLKKLAKNYGVEDRITIKKEVSQKELISEFHKHQAFILPSRSDCFSLTMREAMSSGCICTALELKNAYSWAENKAFIAKNYETMANFLKYAFDSNKIGMNYNFAKSLFDFETLSTELCDFIENINAQRLTF